MTLITADELMRGLALITFGSAAGGLAIAAPGSPLWLVPAALGVGASALTVPEIREEARKALPALAEAPRRLPAPARELGDGLRQFGRLSVRDKARFLAGDDSLIAASSTPPGPEAPDPLFATLDEEPHRLIIGHTRGGKSTAMHAMTAHWRRQGHPVVVCDPDAARGQWPGCQVAGYNEDYAGIARALSAAGAEFRRRSAAYVEGQRDFTPFHVVIDEVQEVFREVPPSKAAVETFARRGAKRGIFVTLGTQDNHVDSLGLDSAAVLQNFITAELRKDKDGRRVATVYRGNAARRRDERTFPVPQLPDPKQYITPAAVAAPAPRAYTGDTRPHLVAEPTRPAAPAARDTRTPLELPDLLDCLLAERVPSAVSRRPDAEIRPDAARIITNADTGNTSRISVDTAAGGGVTVNVAQVATAARRPTRGGGLDMRARRQRQSRYGRVRALVADGARFEDVYRAVKGNRNEVHAEFKRAKAELGQGEAK